VVVEVVVEFGRRRGYLFWVGGLHKNRQVTKS
jgi:hypothetical protein